MTMLGYAGVWIAVAVILAAVEAATVQMVAIWAAVGAIVATIPALMGLSLTTQFVVFVITTGILLLCTRPFVMKVLKPKHQDTNAKMVIGCVGIVTEEVDNDHQTGRVSANGLSWLARSNDDTIVIPTGVKVEVLSLEGVKIIVKPYNQD